MNEQAKALRREYHRKWNQANRDKVRASMERYWERKAAKAAQEAEAQRQAECQAEDPTKAGCDHVEQ